MLKEKSDETCDCRIKKISKYYEKLDQLKVKCTLCPNYCILKEDEVGICHVRQNLNGDLYNLNYGLSTYFVIEPVETNAVFNYMPGQLALSCGSVGCNLDCSFCQAWKYSKSFQIKNEDYYSFCTPEEVVQKAKKLNLQFIAWTFNDPISFFEFVLDASMLAKKEGIKCIFKSSHYINPKPLLDIMSYIDIFCVSLKSIDDEFYKKLCSGGVEPVLNAIKLLKANNKYMEICNLVVPGYNNSDENFSGLIEWVKKTVGTDVPLHFARFHPDYKMLDVERTPIEDIHRAVALAKVNGFSYVYSGNVFIDPYLNTYCPNCNHLIVERRGERSWIRNKNNIVCDQCGAPLDIIFTYTPNGSIQNFLYEDYNWKEDIWSFHLQVDNKSDKQKRLLLAHQFSQFQAGDDPSIDILEIAPGEKIRYAINRINQDHLKTNIIYDSEIDLKFFDSLDRAYYYWGD